MIPDAWHLHLVLVLAGTAGTAYFAGVFAREILGSLGAAWWAERAFTPRALAAEGVKGFSADDEDVLAPLPAAAPVRELRPALAWRAQARASARAAGVSLRDAVARPVVAAGAAVAALADAPAGPAGQDAGASWDEITAQMRERFANIRAGLSLDGG